MIESFWLTLLNQEFCQYNLGEFILHENEDDLAFDFRDWHFFEPIIEQI